MALTEAQLYNLAVGDEVIVHGKCEDVYGNEDIRVNTYWTVVGEKREQSFLVHSSYVSLPPEKPKYDPCRLFRKGDVVEPKQVKGRVYSKDSKHLIGKKCIVFRDEEEPGWVVILHEGKNYSINAAYLELVTPIEELEPYSVGESTDYFSVDDREGEELSIYWKDKHPNAKEAAEAECSRLNAEHRKEQNND